MNECKNGLTYEQILQDFGSDKMMEVCKNCDNLIYENGIMTCKILEERLKME